MLDNSAKTLGLTFPITLLDRADEVIERLSLLLAVGSIGQCNTARSLSAGVSKPKVFRGR